MLIGLILLAVVGILLSLLQLPGVWLVLAATAAYDWYYGWERIGWKWLVVLALVAGIAELIDGFASVVATKKAGASRRAVVGALIGGFAGMIVFSLPAPILGTIAGGILGCFAGAMIGELSARGDDIGAGAKAGLFAAIGKVAGLIAKTAAAMTIAGAVVAMAIHEML